MMADDRIVVTAKDPRDLDAARRVSRIITKPMVDEVLRKVGEKTRNRIIYGHEEGRE